MKIGLNVGYDNIDMVIFRNDEIVGFADRPIASPKRDGNRTIMEKILSMIHNEADCRIKGIGLSLPSRIDETKGVVYDLNYIPYWKGMGIKKILEDEFNTRVWINNDVNCFILGEKHHGSCTKFKDVICVTLGPNIGTGIIVNDKLYYENNSSGDTPKCLSIPAYNCIRTFKSSYMRTVEDLNYLVRNHIEEISDAPEHQVWKDIGTLVGQLITILLCNYTPQVIVLGGTLAKSYTNYSETINQYLEKYIHPQILLNLVILASVIKNQKALGAASMVRHQTLY